MCQCQQLLLYLMKATSVLESIFAILLKFQAHELLCGRWVVFHPALSWCCAHQLFNAIFEFI